MAFRSKGPLRAFRVADGRHPLFSGEGAAQFGGRWNSPGRRVIYGARSYAGALLDRLAQSGIGQIPARHLWVEITVPDDVDLEEVSEDDVPGWDAPDLIASRGYGDRWLKEGRTAVLVVPSVVGRPHEQSVILSQDHPQFMLVTASDPFRVRWDPRLAAEIADDPRESKDDE
jgi:RES domain-containing protein